MHKLVVQRGQGESLSFPKIPEKLRSLILSCLYNRGTAISLSLNTIREMAMLTLYTITSLVFAAVTLIGSGKWLRVSENRKLKRVLRNGREYEALILDARSIRPSIFSTENIRLKVHILAETPFVVEFDYDASYPEWRELMTGKVITVDIDPGDPRNVLIIRKSSRPTKVSSVTSNALLAF